MAKAPGSMATGGRVAFQVDRLEFQRGARCAVHGRWTGVRGRRFMRPALTLIVGGRPVRLLADLEHKPWAAEDGTAWMAEFACSFEPAEVQEAELTVAPDITVTLPLERASRGTGKRARPVVTAPARTPVTSARQAERHETAGAGEVDGRAHLRRQLTELQEQRRRMRDELERLQTEASASEARTADLAAGLEEASRERDELRRERDQASRRYEDARQARARVTADLESAQQERAAALESSQTACDASDRFLSARGAALAAQSRAESEREAAVAARDQALAERDAALALRDHALAERDAAAAARDKALVDRTALVRSNDRLQTELADQVSARRGAALVIRRAAQEPPASRPFALLVPRALALIGLVILALVILAVIKVI